MTKERIRALLAAATSVAKDPAVVEPLVLTTGLSRENVLLGLSRHLETSGTDADLDALLRSVTRAARVHVILSPSVFVAPLRAIALGLASSERVTVKPSRREAFFARALVDALADPHVTLEPDLAPEDVPEGIIHAYGRDETLRAVRERAKVRVLGHGTGMGIAVVAGELARAAEALAEDVIPFDQRGCLSPRVAFVMGDAKAFARVLFDALEARAREVPRGGPRPHGARRHRPMGRHRDVRGDGSSRRVVDGGRPRGGARAPHRTNDAGGAPSVGRVASAAAVRHRARHEHARSDSSGRSRLAARQDAAAASRWLRRPQIPDGS